jgi:NAD+ diphosphatase
LDSLGRSSGELIIKYLESRLTGLVSNRGFSFLWPFTFSHERNVGRHSNSSISCISPDSPRHVNFLGGSPLNRLSWLRTSSVFINALLDSPSTRWVAFQDGKPLLASRTNEVRLALLTTSEVEPFLGSKPYFGQGPGEGALATVDLPILQAARFRGAPVVFLGLSETSANDYSPTTPHEQLAKALIGTPFFSIDLTEISQTELDRLVQTSTAGTDGYTLSFAEPRSATRGMSEFDAAIFAEARSMVDWNFRNKV